MEQDLKIYLAGHVQLVKYREYVKTKYKDSSDFVIIDPLDYEDWSVEESGQHQKIIDTDMKLLNFCDILIADISMGPTFGTVSEIALMNHLYKKPVFIFNIPDGFKNNPWLIGQSTGIFNSVDECFDYLKKNKQKYIPNIQKPPASKSILRRISMS